MSQAYIERQLAKRARDVETGRFDPSQELAAFYSEPEWDFIPDLPRARRGPGLHLTTSLEAAR